MAEVTEEMRAEWRAFDERLDRMRSLGGGYLTALIAEYFDLLLPGRRDVAETHALALVATLETNQVSMWSAEDEDTDGWDLSSCAYYQARGGICSFGCREEPECVTCEPAGGWPSGRPFQPGLRWHYEQAVELARTVR